jgi:hypothetical protein
MALLVIGIPFALLGATMMVRGWVYTLRPDGAMAKKRQKVNLKRGFTTDMKVFGRKVRRLGLMLLLVGATMIGWQRASAADDAATTTSAPTTTP